MQVQGRRESIDNLLSRSRLGIDKTRRAEKKTLPHAGYQLIRKDSAGGFIWRYHLGEEGGEIRSRENQNSQCASYLFFLLRVLRLMKASSMTRKEGDVQWVVEVGRGPDEAICLALHRRMIRQGRQGVQRVGSDVIGIMKDACMIKDEQFTHQTTASSTTCSSWGGAVVCLLWTLGCRDKICDTGASVVSMGAHNDDDR